MRTAPAAMLVVLALTAAGCGSDSGGDAVPTVELDQEEVTGEQVIREWTAAHASDDYEAAADLFAPGALVTQARATRLDTRAEAIAFNRSLPCRAEVTDLERAGDGGEATIAAFVLREGPQERCGPGVGGGARVRFVVRDGLIREWRQLPDLLPEPGSSA